MAWPPFLRRFSPSLLPALPRGAGPSPTLASRLLSHVVSVIDEQDGKPYYAQIRGFIQDQYCEKSAALTWLIPTLSSPRDQFDPASYIIGPEEDLPRKMEYLEFVCHAPSEYFKSRSSPFPTVPTRPEKGYIWTHVGPTPAITIKETVANHL